MAFQGRRHRGGHHSGLAPAIDAETKITGMSTLGSGATANRK